MTQEEIIDELCRLRSDIVNTGGYVNRTYAQKNRFVQALSEVIEKMYEQKKQEKDEIKVGDEVILNANSSYETKAIVIMNDNNTRYPYNVLSADGETEWVERDAIDGKTGRTFSEIAEVLKKMKEVK